MNIEADVGKLMQRIQSGGMDDFLGILDRRDFGLYIPTYVSANNTIKLLEKGASQVEVNLKIRVSYDEHAADAYTVAWCGGGDDGGDNGSKCRHPKENSCVHCTKHDGGIRRCKHPRPGDTNHHDLPVFIRTAPALSYMDTLIGFPQRSGLVRQVAKFGFGVALLHGHSDEHMFTALPRGVVSVICNGTTDFRLDTVIAGDASFCPNMWRSYEGQWHVAGGFSTNP